MPDAGYSGTPLVKKLGITADSRLLLLGAPTGFEALLGALPPGVRVSTRPGKTADLIVCFVASTRELERRLPQVLRVLGQGVWFAWPKKASGVVTDLTESVVRDRCLSLGLVDYKVCAIDATWSGLKFARRKPA